MLLAGGKRLATTEPGGETVAPKATDEVGLGRKKTGGHVNRHNNKSLTNNSQKLRKEMTKEERHLWYDFLKGLPVTVNRQKVFGDYILDFYCAAAGIAIELDGSQHYEEVGREKDRVRDAYLKSKGITVLRYSNYDVNHNFSGVCEDIRGHLIRQLR